MPRNLAVLAGNGLSVAFHPQLNLRSITQKMIERMKLTDHNGDDVVTAMRNIAERALPRGATSQEDFEILVGALSSETKTLEKLAELADLLSPDDEDIRPAITTVSKFIEQLRDTGLSHVLEVIFENSEADWETLEPLHELLDEITDSFDGKITFGNLNYDTILLSGLLSTCRSELADLAHGWRTTQLTVNGTDTVFKPRLRRNAQEFHEYNARIRLLHLHGSLTYWTDRSQTKFVKLERDFVRRNGQWQTLREPDPQVRPVVVLASQREKSEHVEKYPFSLAYEMFEEGLAGADDWVIIGYSFRDECVNERLASMSKEEIPNVLVSTFGDSPTRREVEAAFGWDPDDGDSGEWLSIDRGGVKNLRQSENWDHFIRRRTNPAGCGALSDAAETP